MVMTILLLCLVPTLLTVPHDQATGVATGWNLPRTPWGDPDLQGIWGAGYLLTPLERPAQYANRTFLTDAEVRALEEATAATFGIGGGAYGGTGRGRPPRRSIDDVESAYNDVFSGFGRSIVRTKRTSLIVDPPDGKIPALTPTGQKRVASLKASSTFPPARADGPEDRMAGERCLGVTLPLAYGSASSSGGYSQIVQSPNAVSIYYEQGYGGGAYRVILLDDRPHLPAAIRQWLGDSRGHWEGDTLVIDVTNFTDHTNYHGSGDTLHVVERFTRVDLTTILYRATIDDPTTFTKAWTLEVPLIKAPERQNQIFESACHEGNYGLIGILTGARATDRETRRGR
jgi:hypothetical protein